MSTPYGVPLIIRGKIIEGDELTFGGRRGGVSFTAPDVSKYASELALRAPSMMSDLYTLSLDQIVEYLVELGQRLVFSDNKHLQQAFELSCATSGLSESILRFHYSRAPRLFERQELHNIVARSVGADYLEGWVEQPGSLIPGVTARTRAFGRSRPESGCPAARPSPQGNPPPPNGPRCCGAPGARTGAARGCSESAGCFPTGRTLRTTARTPAAGACCRRKPGAAPARPGTRRSGRG